MNKCERRGADGVHMPAATCPPCVISAHLAHRRIPTDPVRTRCVKLNEINNTPFDANLHPSNESAERGQIRPSVRTAAMTKEREGYKIVFKKKKVINVDLPKENLNALFH